MKMRWMQIFLLSAATAVPPATLTAQSTIPTPNQPGAMPGMPMPAGAGMAGTMTAGPATDDQTVKDKMFLHDAAEGGLAEVQLGQLAADKAASPDVKAFGQKMVTDHTALNNDLKPIAESMGVMLPRKVKKDDQAEYDKLSALSGDDFDKEYLTFMVKDHHADLRAFRQESVVTHDPTLKAAVDKGFSVILEHTRMVDKLATDKGIPVPQRRRPSPPPPPSN
jgi:putative membrane protein